MYESGESNGQISIMDLFDNPDININNCESSLTINDLILEINGRTFSEIDQPQQLIESRFSENLVFVSAYLMIEFE